MDGISLFKSSTSQFWPILALIAGTDKPFPIGVYHGNSKPTSVNDYLLKFVEETNEILRTGIVYNGKMKRIQIAGLVCDAPATAFVTGTVGHTSKSGCRKCVTNGEYYRVPGKKGGRMTYPDMEAALR